MMSQFKYRVNIVWSEEDQAYLVELPEFATEVQRYFTDGDTYGEALRNAEEVLELLIESYQVEGRPLPQPQILQAA
jgi:antitoxin HicB